MSVLLPGISAMAKKKKKVLLNECPRVCEATLYNKDPTFVMGKKPSFIAHKTLTVTFC